MQEDETTRTAWAAGASKQRAHPGAPGVRAVLAAVIVPTVLLVIVGAWSVVGLLRPELRRRLPGTNRRLAAWALLVLLFTAVGAPGMPLPAVKITDIVLWTLMGAVVLTVGGHHLHRGLRALSRRGEDSDNLAGPRMRRGRRMPTAPGLFFRFVPQGVSEPGDLLRWALIVAGGFGCLTLGDWIELPFLTLWGAVALGLGSLGLEISLAVQAWNIWQNRRRHA